jgi:formate dehydrogenase major subunit
MTERTPNHDLRPADLLEISRADACRLGLRDGDSARVISRWGATVLPIGICSRVQPGQVFATFHTSRAFLNRVTSPRQDPTGTPEYKVTAVRVEPVTMSAEWSEAKQTGDTSEARLTLITSAV